MTEPGRGTEAESRCMTPLEAHVEQLIPGIPNEITVEQITTKLPWPSIVVLAEVSRSWCHAIRSRQVYNARVRSRSTESFCLLFRSPAENVHAISVCNFDADCAHCVLPPLTSECFDEVTEPWGRTATLDGRVYVLGGLDCKLHVLDVAGRREWKQCANMLNPREEFGCGVIDGKIYVFGGAVKHECMCGSELYNPRNDTWYKFRPIASLRCGYQAPRLTRELAERFDRFYYKHHKGLYPWMQFHAMDLAKDAGLLEVYDPIQDEWRLVEPVGRPKERMFVAGDKFYSMSPIGVHVYDFHENSWAHLHSFSFASIASVDSVNLWPLAFLTDDKELLVMVQWPSAAERTNRPCLFQSRGLGSANKELVWQRAEFSFDHGPGTPSVHVIAKNCIVL